METPKRRSQYLIWLLMLVLSQAGMRGLASAEEPPFDFSDQYYLQNGIDPSKLLGRVNGADGTSAVDITDDPTRRDVRVTLTTGGFNASGNLIYYSVFGMMMPDVFTNDAAGQQAMEIANSYRAFIFSKASGDPVSPMPPNRRQDNMFDTRNGYFSVNPLGLWIMTFVSYTDKAFNTPEGQKVLADLAKKNGLDLDGTPIIKTAGDVDSLALQGFVALRTRKLDGSEGFPWVV
ncbi:MAG: hypothetical protein HYY11_05600 [Candidatus Methylomirabilis oxyfera]|nr:hypothetical protein [Candidatus Methylomirabilis oxyfera]